MVCSLCGASLPRIATAYVQADDHERLVHPGEKVIWKAEKDVLD